MRPGWKTTEFWLVAFVNAIAGLQASGIFADGSAGSKILALVLMAATSSGYVYGRAYVKAAGAKKPDEITVNVP